MIKLSREELIIQNCFTGLHVYLLVFFYILCLFYFSWRIVNDYFGKHSLLYSLISDVVEADEVTRSTLVEILDRDGTGFTTGAYLLTQF